MSPETLITREELAIALSATKYDSDMTGRTEEYDSLPHHKKLSYLVEADKFIKAINWIKKNREER